MTRRNIFYVVGMISFILVYQTGLSDDREDEIREKMWGTPGDGFEVVEIPKKWAGKSAVYIARLNHFEYKKPPIINVLKFNDYNHYRIKLLDKAAIEDYAEISYMNSNVIAGLGTKVYVGIKVIKSDGSEHIVDLSAAVKMEQKALFKNRSYSKIAVPNLEPGDIIDYYVCEESVMPSSSEIYFFDPVLYHLPQRFPVMKQKLQFNVQRRCFINLRSLNGAPELKLITDEETDEQYYLLEDNDREDIEELRWFYPYRELPSVKFRASYASGKAIRKYGVLLGEPGIVKNSVTEQELAELVYTLLSGTVSNYYELTQYAKNELKDLENEDVLRFVEEVYYFYRSSLIKDLEKQMLDDGDPFVFVKDLQFTDTFSSFLKYKKIPHDIILSIPRNISSLDDVLLENELEMFVRVKKGEETLFLSPPNINSLAGGIDEMVEGSEAYALNGNTLSKKTQPVKIQLPGTNETDNHEERTMKVVLSDDMDRVKISASNKVKGALKVYPQQALMDIYDIEEEDREKYELKESFSGYAKNTKKKYEEVKEGYLSRRDELKKERLKSVIENNFNFEIDDHGGLAIRQTGRYRDQPEMAYEFNFETKDIINKAGNNYLLDIGKLIEGQVQIDGDELDRDYNIYMDFPRSYKLNIELEIPKGYSVQGLEKLNQEVDNNTGGFKSSATMENGVLKVQTYKFYRTNYVNKEDWPKMIEFLNAAHNFTEQKILIRKGK